jgi:hypothetical protein
MGVRFSLEHANIVAYLTSPDPGPPPRIVREKLHAYLYAIAHRDGSLVSSDPDWVDQVQAMAMESLNRFTYIETRDDEPLDVEFVENVLSDLKREFSRYELYGLFVGGRTDGPTFDPHAHAEVKSFFGHAAVSSRHHALFLIPDFHESGSFSILDPLPFVAEVVEHPESWPGVLFWTSRGSHAFAPLKEAYGLYQSLLDDLEGGGDSLDDILDDYRGRSRPKSKKLLQLSDLHFGTTRATANQGYVTAHLTKVANGVDRIVITGDLFDEPVYEQAATFHNFRGMLYHLTGKDPIVIPGNHDQKWLGNKKGPLRELADLEWTNLLTDDELECNFFCFDSSRDADWARGKVSREQMVSVGTLDGKSPADRGVLSLHGRQ